MNVYRIGQLAELANVSRRTIDYYTQLGMLNYEKKLGQDIDITQKML
ncbi:MerR family transcriptional regulator [Peribacillus frigoritolerans]|nr:MerR family transcriptional regulator [Peribacillus frigoritolerans]